MGKIISEFLAQKLKEQYGEEIYNKIAKGLISNKKTTFRINKLKSSKEEIEEVLLKNKIEYSVANWYEDAIILENVDENKIRELNIYEEGKIYLQSLSSMIPVLVLEPKEKENILDMCAAPGGKTTQIAAISQNRSMITACEKNKIRAERLKYNLEKQGVKNTNIMITDSRYLSDFFSFDKILLDAPCSGSGTDNIFSRDFSEDLIKRSSLFQENLLKKALKLVKSGHEIVYSTCSILREENEAILKKVESEIEVIPINENRLNNAMLLPTEIRGTICICPTENYEGFFVAKLRKK